MDFGLKGQFIQNLYIYHTDLLFFIAIGLQIDTIYSDSNIASEK